MPRIEICTSKFLDYTQGKSNIFFRRVGSEENAVSLSAAQINQLFCSLRTIEAEADLHWSNLNADAKREFSHHLGWRFYLTLMEFKNCRYYDIRRFWIPPGQNSIVPTKMGIRFTEKEMDNIRLRKEELYQALPGVETVDDCKCFFQGFYQNCRRCNPFSNTEKKLVRGKSI